MRLEFSALLAPTTCSGCGTPGVLWCAACALVPRAPIVSDVGMRVHSDYFFSGPVRRTIIDWKDEHRHDARQRVIAWFAQGLAPLLEANPGSVVVPVAPAPQSWRRRGAPVLLEAVQSAVPGVDVQPWLASTRPRADQAGLQREARRHNLAGAMRWIGPAEQPVILVDDVFTTGATLRESARAMRDAGAVSCVAFTIAHRIRVAPVVRSCAGLRLPQDDDLGGFRG